MTEQPDPLADWLYGFAVDLARREHTETEVEALRPMLLALAKQKAEELRRIPGSRFPQGDNEPTN